MKNSAAVQAFGALAQVHRLAIFRILLRRGPPGLPAGEIAEAIGVSPSALSFHLRALERGDLVRGFRIGQRLYYAVHIEGTRRLVEFLTEECCEGRPELCAPMLLTGETNGGDQLKMTDKAYNVLFLCTGNSARSIMAECILNRLGAGRFAAYSAGSHPKGEVHPYALNLLRQQNYPTERLRSKDWSEFAAEGAPALDFVFTVCDKAAAEVCPAWPGQPMTAHWGLPDPAAVEGSEAVKRAAFADTMRMLNNRIDIFVNLPLASLDKLSLRKRLESIGRAVDATV